MTKDIKEKIVDVAEKVRLEIEEMYLPLNKTLGGTCIEASNRIVSLLKEEGIDSQVVQGFVEYDMPPRDAEIPYEEHCWVEVFDGVDYLYVDVTASQFNSYVLNEFDSVIVSTEKPSNILYEDEQIERD